MATHASACAMGAPHTLCDRRNPQKKNKEKGKSRAAKPIPLSFCFFGGFVSRLSVARALSLALSVFPRQWRRCLTRRPFFFSPLFVSGFGFVPVFLFGSPTTGESGPQPEGAAVVAASVSLFLFVPRRQGGLVVCLAGAHAKPFEGEKEGKSTGKETGRVRNMGPTARREASVRWACAVVALCTIGAAAATLVEDFVAPAVRPGGVEARALRNAMDGACFVALATGAARLFTRRAGSGWRAPAGSMAAAAAAGALAPDYMQASPWSLALFCGCALVGVY